MNESATGKIRKNVLQVDFKLKFKIFIFIFVKAVDLERKTKK